MTMIVSNWRLLVGKMYLTANDYEKMRSNIYPQLSLQDNRSDKKANCKAANSRLTSIYMFSRILFTELQ